MSRFFADLYDHTGTVVATDVEVFFTDPEFQAADIPVGQMLVPLDKYISEKRVYRVQRRYLDERMMVRVTWTRRDAAYGYQVVDFEMVQDKEGDRDES